MKRIRRRHEARRIQRTEALVEVLARDPSRRLTADALGAETRLGAAVYPLLAALDRIGAVERRWTETDAGPALTYRLTSDGLALSRAPRSVLAERLLDG